MVKQRGIWLKNHQLIVFFILTYAITWGIAALVFLLPKQIEAIFGKLNVFNPLFILAVAAPTISATLLTAIWEGKSGLGILYGRLIRWRFGIQWYAVVLIGVPLLGWLTTLVAGSTPQYDLSTTALIISALLNLLITGPLGEELGWRGYALPRLLTRFNPFFTSLMLGVIWGVWHLPSLFISSLVQSQLTIPVFIFGAICMSVLVTWLFQHSGGSILITILFHYMVNFSMSVIGAPFSAFMMVLLLCAVLVVLIDRGFGWFQKANVSY
jgi:CAAX protease family protein